MTVLKLFSIIETNIMKCVYGNLKPSILKMNYGRNTLSRVCSSYFRTNIVFNMKCWQI